MRSIFSRWRQDQRRGDRRRGANLDVAKVREKTGLSQDRFAGAFAINPSTLRNWEQGRTRPDGAARVLLTVIIAIGSSPPGAPDSRKARTGSGEASSICSGRLG